MSNSATSITGFSSEAFEAFLASRNEPQWLTAQRKTAWDVFSALPIPNRSSEEWLRTDVRGLKLAQYGSPSLAADDSTIPKSLLAEGVQLGGRTATLDSKNVVAELDQELIDQGVVFGGLEELAGEHEKLIQPRLFTKGIDFRTDKFAALHGAFMSGGTFLYVPKRVVIEKPLHILSAMTSGGVDFGQTLVILDEGAEATLLSETASVDPTGAGLHCGAIALFVGPRARLRYVNLQNWGTGVWHFAQQRATVDRDGRLQWTIGALGARTAKVNQHVALVGPGADAQVNGAMFAEGKQHLAYHTYQRHHVPQCRSDLLYKSALQDRSHIVWQGMIKVDPAAQQTNGYQRNDSLMLSNEAHSDSIPGLEIEADDVKCSHGATSGRVDDELVFYARSRGLTKREAIRMIVAGFFQQVFDRITVESVRHALGEAIGRRIREYD